MDPLVFELVRKLLEITRKYRNLFEQAGAMADYYRCVGYCVLILVPEPQREAFVDWAAERPEAYDTDPYAVVLEWRETHQ